MVYTPFGIWATIPKPLERNFVQKGLSEWLPFSSIMGKQCDFEEIIFEENRGAQYTNLESSSHTITKKGLTRGLDHMTPSEVYSGQGTGKLVNYNENRDKRTKAS
ncbi:hypothetical protein [Acetomicrobium sp.]|uniref:hypothetical protein n=1 Tax=Acetomicrobium sp. TaxID=1872099 RepID=UPI002FC97CEC